MSLTSEQSLSVRIERPASSRTWSIESTAGTHRYDDEDDLESFQHDRLERHQARDPVEVLLGTLGGQR